MEKIDQISVIMPTYNAMPFVKASVESILTQTFKSYEFVIVNRNSSDGTNQYLDSLKDPRVRVIHDEKFGIEESLNLAIHESKFDWIARMDADDIALPQRIEKQVKFVESNHQYALISCAAGYIGASGRRLKATHFPALSTPPFYDPMIDSMIFDQGMLFKRSSVMRIGGYRMIGPAEGLDFVLRLDEAGYKMTSVPEVLMLVRILNDGVSAQNFIEQRVTWKYMRACSRARRSKAPEPDRVQFFATQWPKGWKRLKVESERHFRLAGAAWGANNFFEGALRFLLSFILYPKHLILKCKIYFFSKSKNI